MLPDQRRNKVLQLIEKEGFASLQFLSEGVAASESTVRRDLELLERSGHVRRTRGGAAYVGESLTSLDARFQTQSAQKRLIGEAAAELVQSGEAVLLDGGSTTFEVARALMSKSIQVVTNSLPVLALLANQSQIELVSLGGYVYPTTGVALGPITVAALSRIHVRRLFISVGGITERGLYNSNSLLVDTELAMLAAADEVVVVTDSSKLGHSALAHLCGLDRVQRIVVDAGITREWRGLLEQQGVALTIVGEGAAELAPPLSPSVHGSIQLNAGPASKELPEVARAATH